MGHDLSKRVSSGGLLKNDANKNSQLLLSAFLYARSCSSASQDLAQFSLTIALQGGVGTVASFCRWEN